MAATFVVEDGTGLSTANSYVSVADATQYHENHGDPTDWSGAAEADQQDALREATQYLDATYNGLWKGYRANETQALDWPRDSVEDSDGYVLDNDAIPTAIEEATAYLALKALEGDTLVPDQTNPGDIKAERYKVGPLEEDIEYIGGKSAVKRYVIVEGMLRDLLFTSGAVWRG